MKVPPTGPNAQSGSNPSSGPSQPAAPGLDPVGRVFAGATGGAQRDMKGAPPLTTYKADTFPVPRRSATGRGSNFTPRKRPSPISTPTSAAAAVAATSQEIAKRKRMQTVQKVLSVFGIFLGLIIAACSILTYKFFFFATLIVAGSSVLAISIYALYKACKMKFPAQNEPPPLDLNRVDGEPSVPLDTPPPAYTSTPRPSGGQPIVLPPPQPLQPIILFLAPPPALLQPQPALPGPQPLADPPPAFQPPVVSPLTMPQPQPSAAPPAPPEEAVGPVNRKPKGAGAAVPPPQPVQRSGKLNRPVKIIEQMLVNRVNSIQEREIKFQVAIQERDVKVFKALLNKVNYVGYDFKKIKGAETEGGLEAILKFFFNNGGDPATWIPPSKGSMTNEATKSVNFMRLKNEITGISLCLRLGISVYDIAFSYQKYDIVYGQSRLDKLIIILDKMLADRKAFDSSPHRIDIEGYLKRNQGMKDYLSLDIEIFRIIGVFLERNKPGKKEVVCENGQPYFPKKPT